MDAMTWDNLGDIAVKYHDGSVEELLTNGCRHCGLPKRKHVRKKCLFDATTFTPFPAHLLTELHERDMDMGFWQKEAL
jgi:hypothetical protein